MKVLKYPRTWRDFYIYFWVFGVIGHFVEIAWSFVQYLSTGFQFHPQMPTITPLAAPYGLASAVLILIIRIFKDKYKKTNIVIEFAACAIIGTVIEFICGLLVMLFCGGENTFWDYSHEKFNFMGQICLHNTLLFGAGLLLFIRFVFPKTEKKIQETKPKIMWEWFWLLFASYALDALVMTFTDLY